MTSAFCAPSPTPPSRSRGGQARIRDLDARVRRSALRSANGLLLAAICLLPPFCCRLSACRPLPGVRSLGGHQFRPVVRSRLLVQGTPDEELLPEIVQEGLADPPPGVGLPRLPEEGDLDLQEPRIIRRRLEQEFHSLLHPEVKGGQPHPRVQLDTVLV